MSIVKGQNGASPARHRCALASHLKARRDELDEAVLLRIKSLGSTDGEPDPRYWDQLRLAVGTAIDYGLGVIDGSERMGALPPALLISQARLAARAEIPLDAVMRRYFSGFALLGDMVLQEGERCRVPQSVLQALMREQSLRFELLLEAVGNAYRDEFGIVSRDAAGRKLVGRIQRLLKGEPADWSGLGYSFDASHIAVVGVGEAVKDAVRDLASAFDRQLLVAHPEDEVVWAWIGGREEIADDAFDRALASVASSELVLAVGEPNDGRAGWNLSHRQAEAALPIALRRQQAVRYCEVAILASLVQDDLLAASLATMYLAPLRGDADGGQVARETLRAYFGSNRNVTSAAAALGVNRRTLASRISAIENKIGRPIASSPAQVEAALLLDELWARDSGSSAEAVAHHV